MDDVYAAWVLRPTLPSIAVEPQLAWFLCGVQRSGIWLLAGLLNSTGIAGRPHEWFSEATEVANRRTWRVSPTGDYSETDHGIEPLELSFDDVVANPRGASARVLAHLGLPHVPAIAEPSPPSDWRHTCNDRCLGQRA